LALLEARGKAGELGPYNSRANEGLLKELDDATVRAESTRASQATRGQRRRPRSAVQRAAEMLLPDETICLVERFAGAGDPTAS